MVSTMPVNMTGRLQAASEHSTVICRRTREYLSDDVEAEQFRPLGRGLLRSAHI